MSVRIIGGENSSSDSLTDSYRSSSDSMGGRRKKGGMAPGVFSQMASSYGGKRRGKRGGAGESGSAWNYVGQTVGSGDQQWNNVFVKGGNFGNDIQNLSGTQPYLAPSSMNPAQLGGSKRRRRPVNKKSRKGGKKSYSKKSKKGGFWGNVVSQALVPFGLLAAQNVYARRTRKNRK
jgi:hypothetical protein